MRSPQHVTRGLGATAVVALAGLLAAACTSSGPTPTATATGTPIAAGTGRAPQYSSFHACLLTGAGGISTSPARSAWAGMKDASQVTHARVSYLVVAGPQTEANASTYIGSLIAQKCGVIVAAGQAEAAAVTAMAGHYRTMRFAVVIPLGGQVAGGAENVATVLGGPSAIESGVASFVEQDAGS